MGSLLNFGSIGRLSRLVYQSGHTGLAVDRTRLIVPRWTFNTPIQKITQRLVQRHASTGKTNFGHISYETRNVAV